MPQPTAAQVHVDAVLSNISVAYLQSTDGFIADKVFPNVPSDKASDVYFIYNKNDWFRDEAAIRAPATESAGSGYTLATSNYVCNVWAIHKDVSDQEIANSDVPLKPESDAAKFVTGRLALRREKQFIADFLQTGLWGTADLTGVASAPGANQFVQWSDFVNSDPLEDIEQGKENILGVTGFMANTLVLGYQVYRKLKNHPDIVDRIKFTSGDPVTTAIMARFFDVDQVLVARSIAATNKEGATGAYAFNLGKVAFLCYSAPAPGLQVPSAGYTFGWTGVSDGEGLIIGTSQIPVPLKRAQRIEAQAAWANKIVAADLGQFYTTVVA